MTLTALIGAPRLTMTALVATLVFAAATACSGDTSNRAADPTPSTATPTETTSTSPTPSSTGGPPAGWEDKFSDEQLRAFRAALIRWNRYTDLTHAIYRKGKDTPQARAVFQEYSIRWQGDVAVLADTVARSVRVVEPEKPLWTMAKSVRLNNDGTGSAVIIQCTDYSKVRLLRSGKPYETSRPDHLVTPLVVEMVKPKDRNWMLARTELRDKRTCSA